MHMPPLRSMPLPSLTFVLAEGYVSPEAAVLSQLHVKLLNDYLSEVGGMGKRRMCVVWGLWRKLVVGVVLGQLAPCGAAAQASLCDAFSPC